MIPSGNTSLRSGETKEVCKLTKNGGHHTVELFSLVTTINLFAKKFGTGAFPTTVGRKLFDISKDMSAHSLLVSIFYFCS
jgi:hypothetical protein